MIRRRLTILLPLAAALTVSGCTTFSDADAVARVGDTELSADELDQLAADAGIPEGQELDPEIVRTLIQGWIQETAINSGEFDPDALGDTDPARVATRFDQGVRESGVVCPAILVTESLDAALDTRDELVAGASFADVFAERNVDETLVASEGQIGCVDINAVLDAADAPEVASLLELDAADPFSASALTDQFGEVVGGIVVAFRPYDELSEADAAAVDTSVQGILAVEEIDVMVDSRYGYFDPMSAAVRPLG